METHFMIFVNTGNLVSPSSSLYGNPLHDFPDHWQPRFSIEFSLRRTSAGADLARPPNEQTYRLQAATAAAILWKVELETS